MNYNNSNINRNNNNKNNGFSARCTQYSLFEPAESAGSIYSKEEFLNDLFFAYYECRKNKRNTINALTFELNFERNLLELGEQVWSNHYKIGRSICFVVKKPVYREIFAADFRDRVIHHYAIGSIIFRLENYFHPRSFACRYGKGTLFGIKTLQNDLQEVKNLQPNAWVLKLDIAGFFMNINRSLLHQKFQNWLEMENDLPSKSLLQKLFHQIINHDPTQNAMVKGSRLDWKKIPKHKSLFGTEEGKGIPIGNLTSQILANFYLSEFDWYVEKELGIKWYGRYVDDFYLIHPSKEKLLACKVEIESYLHVHLGLRLHPNKVHLQTANKGIAFLGAYVFSSHLLVGKRIKQNLFFLSQLKSTVKIEKWEQSWISYQGHCKHFNAKKLLQKVGNRIEIEVLLTKKN